MTARGLQRKSIRAVAPGNPMMDGFHKADCPENLRTFRRLLLLCGSRMPEALINLRSLMSAVLKIKSQIPIAILITTGSEPRLDQIELCLQELGFHPSFASHSQLNVDAFWEKGFLKVFCDVFRYIGAIWCQRPALWRNDNDC